MSVGKEQPEVQVQDPPVQETEAPQELELEQPQTDTEPQDTADGTEPVEEPAAVETPSGEPTDEGEDQDDDWRNSSDVLDFAQSAGVSQDDLSHFADQYDLERFVRMRDRSLIAERQQPSQAPQTQPPQQTAEPYQQAAPAGLPTLDRELLDEATVNALEARDKHWQSYADQLTAMRHQQDALLQHFQQQELQREYARFNEVLDELGHKGLFGDSKQLVPGSPEERNRQRVAAAYSYLPDRQPTKAMITRAANSEFFTELKKESEGKFRKKMVRQSRRVRHGGEGRSQRARQTEAAPEGGVSAEDDRKLKQMGHDMERENL
jgi:hypothetical protein